MPHFDEHVAGGPSVSPFVSEVELVLAAVSDSAVEATLSDDSTNSRLVASTVLLSLGTVDTSDSNALDG